MFDDNVLLLTDGYKFSHYRQYPPGTRTVFSYFESRGGAFPDVTFFGLQYLLKRYLAGPVVTRDRIDYAARRIAPYIGDGHFNRPGWEHILAAHGGRLPVVIRAVPEGTVVPTGNALLTVENTDPACPWLTNYLETLLTLVWYPTTVATQSRYMKGVLLDALRQTGDPAGIEFKLHDFGFRGVSSVEAAAVGGAAHLVNFRGTDTFPGVELAYRYYGEETAGASIPASEHSTITAWGPAHEVDAMRNMLDQYPAGTVACVSDSFDIFRACSDYWGGVLKDRVLARAGTLVVRPDSGDPPAIVCDVLDRLGAAFGFSTNAKGYKVLPPQVRVIQGDGIDRDSLGVILARMAARGWSADNVAFGSGGGLLQKVNRDTLKFAFKCSAADVNGEWRDVFKDPVADAGKRSKRGRLKLLRLPDGGFRTTRDEEPNGDGVEALVPVFRDGAVLNEQTFAAIRGRAAVPA